jgi:hypothetical protein
MVNDEVDGGNGHYLIWHDIHRFGVTVSLGALPFELRMVLEHYMIMLIPSNLKN